MNINQITKEIEILKEQCSTFLIVEEPADEEKTQINQIQNSLQVKAFNGIVSECKEEIEDSDFKKMSGVLKLLYNLDLEPFVSENVSKRIDTFLTTKLCNDSLDIGETQIQNMEKLVKNIDYLCNIINAEFLKLKKKEKKLFGSNKKTQRKLRENFQTLLELKQKIQLQMEYSSKQIADNIIDDFYNIYIFFSYIIQILIEKKQQLLSIEVANFLDRYINVTKYIFNNRQLKSQDMIYYYAVYELDELKKSIYEHLNDYKSL